MSLSRIFKLSLFFPVGKIKMLKHGDDAKIN